MLNILSRITGANRAVTKDAKQLYQMTMAQSRQPQFYGDNLCPDSTNGRMEVLCLHISTILYVLRQHDESGAKLSQAIYDVMIDDFDVALREEGLADTGVSRRIKPMAQMFFERAKCYADAFDDRDNTQAEITKIIEKYVCANEDNCTKFSNYVYVLYVKVSEYSLGTLAAGQIEFPKF